MNLPTSNIDRLQYEDNSMGKENEAYDFSEISPSQELLNEIPPLEPYQARDGTSLSFRRYQAKSNNYVILLHGSSAHSAYLHPFAKYLSDTNDANVCALDLRGHGVDPQRRGDIDYIGQLEEDIADLIANIKSTAGDDAKFIIGGHSSGGGTALRFGGSQYGSLVRGVFLLAPYFGHDAPMVKKNAGGWAAPSILKIIGISILNGFGIKRFNGTKVLRFNLPEGYQNGHETLEYSFRLMIGMHPTDYKESLSNIDLPLLILVGTKDEALNPTKFEPNILPYHYDVEVTYVDESSHLGIVLNDSAMAKTASWIEGNLR